MQVRVSTFAEVDVVQAWQLPVSSARPLRMVAEQAPTAAVLPSASGTELLPLTLVVPPPPGLGAGTGVGVGTCGSGCDVEHLRVAVPPPLSARSQPSQLPAFCALPPLTVTLQVPMVAVDPSVSEMMLEPVMEPPPVLALPLPAVPVPVPPPAALSFVLLDEHLRVTAPEASPVTLQSPQEPVVWGTLSIILMVQPPMVACWLSMPEMLT